MAEIGVTVDEAGGARLDLTGSSTVEIRDSVDLSDLEATETVPALESIVLHFDHYGRLARIEVTDSAASMLPPALLDGAGPPHSEPPLTGHFSGRVLRDTLS